MKTITLLFSKFMRKTVTFCSFYWNYFLKCTLPPHTTMISEECSYITYQLSLSRTTRIIVSQWTERHLCPLGWSDIALFCYFRKPMPMPISFIVISQNPNNRQIWPRARDKVFIFFITGTLFVSHFRVTVKICRGPAPS